MDRRHGAAIVVGILLAGALAGVLWAEAREGPDPVLAFPASWSTETSQPATHEDELDEGESETYTFAVTQRNLTRAEARLVWEDDSGGRDRFRVNLTTPDGQLYTNASMNGTIGLPVEVAQVPEASTVNGTDLAAARQRAQDRYASTLGQGTWTVQVTLESAPGQRPVPGQEVEVEGDGSNSYQLQFAYETYAVELDPRPVG